MLIGTQEIKVPFYIIDAPGQTFIMGRISMDYLRMTLEIHNRLARCEPTFCRHFVVPFLHPDEFQSALTVFMLDMDDEENDLYYPDPTENIYSIAEQEVLDERHLAKETYLENLQRDLDEAVENGFITEAQRYTGLIHLNQFWDIFDLNPGKYTGHQVHFNFIEGNEHLKPWRGEKFRPSKKILPAIRKAITKMLLLNIIRYSHSRYINTIAPVIKKNGDIRLCLDADELNKYLANVLTEPNMISSMLYDNAGDKLFCTLDFTAGFWQLELDEESRKFTAFQVEGQVYEFNRLPHGLKILS